ncbi:MAG: glycosyltransferase family 39 protein [Planctomycetes bacterium]|nr:glycosyltransferase family 39 protein [Planctomycetota bacterium]
MIGQREEIPPPAEAGARGEGPDTMRCRPGIVVCMLMVVHVGLLAWGAWQHSPTYDEAGHLPSGLYHWRTGKFELFRVNPPLVRVVAVLPVLPVCPEVQWPEVTKSPIRRPEWVFGKALLETAGEDTRWLFALARWACIPFSLLGIWICYRWSTELFGQGAGLLAASLWCFSPNILAQGQMLTTDVPAASLGALAAYTFWHWLKTPSWKAAVIAGLMLGVVELTKMSWIILFGLWPAVWIIWRGWEHGSCRWSTFRDELAQITCTLLLAIYLINLGYGFDGSGQALGEDRFVSKALAGSEYSESLRTKGGNRFRDTWLEYIPVPVPREYLRGLDRQKWELDRPRLSYLRGQWRERGWWHYYLYAMAIKVPVGTWILALLALFLAIVDFRCRAPAKDEWLLLVMPAVVILLISSQTGFNKHLRYVLPAFPFLFIAISRIALVFRWNHRWIASIGMLALTWSIGSSLWLYPHSMTYFNEAIAGPKNGPCHLGGSNLCVGQDLYYLRSWLESHPEAKPLHVTFKIFYDPAVIGIDCDSEPPPGPEAESEVPIEQRGPMPGWYALDVRQIIHHEKEFAYFQQFEPVALAGYSIRIYHITREQANRVRQELGMPELDAAEADGSPSHRNRLQE